jgi:hypothetical protein
MRRRLIPFAAVLLGVWVLSSGTSSAQQLASVTVAATQPGVISLGCGPSPVVSTPAEFTLTRTGDVTDGLTVSISWSGGLSAGTTISPTSVTFAPGSSTATVTPEFAMVPQSEGGLILSVTTGAGYEPGRPPTASTTFTTYAPPCAPPPALVHPSLTG